MNQQIFNHISDIVERQEPKTLTPELFLEWIWSQTESRFEIQGQTVCVFNVSGRLVTMGDQGRASLYLLIKDGSNLAVFPDGSFEIDGIFAERV